jgi:cytochrome c556
MRIGTLALTASAILFAGAAASASGGGHHGAVALGADPSGIVKGRQAGMRMSAALMGSFKAALDRGDDVKTLAFPAKAVASWAESVPGMFPEGTNVAPTEALPTVWSDAQGFTEKAIAYQTATGKMAAAAAAGDKAAFTAAFGEARAACGACHSGYKKS